jgi:hypothetical protein
MPLEYTPLPIRSLEDAQREIERLARALKTAIDPIPTSLSGPAGGVLGGNYPDPGFAQDMATQLELDSAVTILEDRIKIETGIVGEVWNQDSVLVAQDSSKLRVPFDFTITAAEVTADVIGQLIVEVYRSSYTVWDTFDKLSGGSPIRLFNQKKNQAILTGWTVDVKEGDYLMFRIIDTPILVKQATITLIGRRV